MPSQVAIVAKSDLEKLHTGSLLSRLRRLHQCVESFADSDRYGQEQAPDSHETGHIEFKDSDEWRTAYTDVKEVLALREHVPSAAERKLKREPRGRRQ